MDETSCGSKTPVQVLRFASQTRQMLRRHACAGSETEMSCCIRLMDDCGQSPYREASRQRSSSLQPLASLVYAAHQCQLISPNPGSRRQQEALWGSHFRRTDE